MPEQTTPQPPAPEMLASSRPAPSFIPPDLPQSQLPTPPENGPALGQGQQPPTYAGKFQSPQELERAYLQLEQDRGRQAQEIGSLRDQFFQTQQQMIGMQQQMLQRPPTPQAPPPDPAQEQAKREFELLSPLVQQRIAAAGDGADEDQIWRDTLNEYQIAQVAAQMSMAPLQQQYQQSQQLYTQNLGGQVLNARVQELFARNGYQAINAQQFAQTVGQGLDLGQFLAMPPQEQANILEMAANDMELRALRGQQAQAALQQQYGMQPNGQPIPGGYNPYAPQQQAVPMPTTMGYPTQPLPPNTYPAPTFYPQQQQPPPLPYTGQYNPTSAVPQGQVPATMTGAMPQGAPMYNPEYQAALDYYKAMGITDQARLDRAAREYLARSGRR